jgi:hypothetical protein
MKKSFPATACLAFGLLIIILPAFFVYWTMYRIPVSETESRQLRVGLNKSQVEQLMGIPQGRWETHWLYHSPGSSASFQVWFDKEGNIIEWGRDD